MNIFKFTFVISLTLVLVEATVESQAHFDPMHFAAKEVSQSYEVPQKTTKQQQILRIPKDRRTIPAVAPVPKSLSKPVVVSAHSAATPWNGYFSAQSFSSANEQVELKQIKTTLDRGMKSIPDWHTAALENLYVKNQSHRSRGLANSETLILNVGTIDDQEELLAVFIHEMGHITDLGALEGDGTGQWTSFRDMGQNLRSSDKSVGFYQLSWSDESNRKAGTRRQDFVSGYAMQDPFEDFAETYTFYRLHGEKFRALARNSRTLAKKYAFMKKHVFDGNEYQTEKVINTYENKAWDTTLIAFN